MKIITVLLVLVVIGIPVYVYGVNYVPMEQRSMCSQKSDTIHDLIVAQQNGMDPIDMLDIYLQNFPADGEKGQGIVRVISKLPIKDTPEERHATARRISNSHYQACLSHYTETM